MKYSNTNFQNKEGTGLAIYIKEEGSYRPRLDLSFSPTTTHMFDSIFTEILIPNHTGIILGLIYHTPSYSSITELTNKVNLILSSAMKEKKDIIITGDLNIDLLKCNSHSDTSSFVDMMITNDLIPLITLPTCVTNRSSTLIDHIYSNIAHNKALPGTLLTHITSFF